MTAKQIKTEIQKIPDSIPGIVLEDILKYLKTIQRTIKKTLLLFLTLVTISSKAQTSTYHPFPDSAAMWNIESYLNCGLGFDTWEHLYSIIISDDTIINSINYHKLVVPIEVINSNGMCTTSGAWTVPGYYVGGIRQDTTAKKVFFIPPSTTIEQLLYDFNMQVGDTVKGFTESFSVFSDIVQSIDSVLVGGDYRKRWNINPGYGISFIEGIGSTYGLLGLSPNNTTDGAGYSITCFKQNGILLYPNTAASCELITAVDNISKKPFALHVSPNPFHTTALIRLNSEMESGDLKIFNLLGLQIREESFANQTSLLLNRTGLTNGIYFLKITNNKAQRANGKFIIQ